MDIARGLLQDNVVDGTSPRIQTYRNLRQLNPASEHDESLWVYGRRGKPCRKCGTPIEMKKMGLEARSTYWCPTVSKFAVDSRSSDVSESTVLTSSISAIRLRMRVDVEARAADEAAQRDVRLLRRARSPGSTAPRRRRSAARRRAGPSGRARTTCGPTPAGSTCRADAGRPAACGRRSCRRRCGGRRPQPTTAAAPIDRTARPRAGRRSSRTPPATSAGDRAATRSRRR